MVALELLGIVLLGVVIAVWQSGSRSSIAEDHAPYDWSDDHDLVSQWVHESEAQRAWDLWFDTTPHVRVIRNGW